MNAKITALLTMITGRRFVDAARMQVGWVKTQAVRLAIGSLANLDSIPKANADDPTIVPGLVSGYRGVWHVVPLVQGVSYLFHLNFVSKILGGAWEEVWCLAELRGVGRLFINAERRRSQRYSGTARCRRIPRSTCLELRGSALATNEFLS